MAEQYLNYEGLALYDELIKKYIKDNTASDEDVTNSQNYLLQQLAELGKQVTNNADDIASNDTDIEALKNAVDKLNGDEDTDGSVKNIVRDKIAAVIDGSPEAFDTLKEISDWIENDEIGTAALIDRITALQNGGTSEEIKDYVDTRDEYYYSLTNNISDPPIEALFLTKVYAQQGQTVANAIAALKQGEMLVLQADCTENLTIPANIIIDANNHTLSGNISIDESSTILNATFTGTVTVQ